MSTRAIVAAIITALAILPAQAGGLDGGLTVTSPPTAPIGQPFDVSIDAVAPPLGFAAFQAKLVPTGAAYQPTADFSYEAIWPNCTWPARAENADGSVLFACVSQPTVNDVYNGTLLTFAFQCNVPGTATFDLVPRVGDIQQGSHYIDEQLQLSDPLLVNGATDCPTDWDGDNCADVTELAAGRDNTDPLDWHDLNGDGAVGAADIALVVAGFGGPAPDRNGDSVVTVSDIALVVMQFGEVC